jgi:hypothetical protein
MMKVSLKEMIEVFNDLIEEKKSREEVASWALKRQEANDLDALEFEPVSEKRKIWRGITYLMGVDLVEIDGSYLHSIENFIDFRSKIISDIF